MLSNGFDCAIKNEIAIEEYFYSLKDVEPKDFFYLPRIGKWSCFNNKKLIRIFAGFVWGLWPLFFSPLLIFFQFISCCLIKMITPRIDVQMLNGYNIIVPSTEVSESKILNNVGLIDYAIVYRPTLRPVFKRRSIAYNALSLLSFKELFVVLVSAAVTSYNFSSQPDTKCWRLQTYVVFEWFVMFSALEKISANFYISDHFDRWAVLLDVINKKNLKSGLESSLAVVQHGLVTTDINNMGAGLPFKLPYKLKTVSKLFCFDQGSLSVFKREIFDNVSFTSSFNVVFCPPYITLTKIKSSKRKILFVGHSLCQVLHEKILFEILKKVGVDDYDFYYKPHPTQVLIIDAKTPWNIYRSSTDFPDVDIVITYPSTLGYEYFILGKKVIQHNINDAEDVASTLADRVLTELQEDL